MRHEHCARYCAPSHANLPVGGDEWPLLVGTMNRNIQLAPKPRRLPLLCTNVARTSRSPFVSPSVARPLTASSCSRRASWSAGSRWPPPQPRIVSPAPSSVSKGQAAGLRSYPHGLSERLHSRLAGAIKRTSRATQRSTDGATCHPAIRSPSYWRRHPIPGHWRE
ncbi:hypothetical protein BC826DRAFT_565439 [Russula brevipes]|nr:hypothetical protein BC826DRAFT_565439 [Russula brevipes]